MNVLRCNAHVLLIEPAEVERIIVTNRLGGLAHRKTRLKQLLSMVKTLRNDERHRSNAKCLDKIVGEPLSAHSTALGQARNGNWICKVELNVRASLGHALLDLLAVGEQEHRLDEFGTVDNLRNTVIQRWGSVKFFQVKRLIKNTIESLRIKCVRIEDWAAGISLNAIIVDVYVVK